MPVRVIRCISLPVSHGLNSCTHAQTLSYWLYYKTGGVFLFLWEQRDGKPLKLYPSPLVLYQTFLSPLFLCFLILLNLSHSLCMPSCLKHHFSASLISLSLCTSFLFYPFPPLLCHLPLVSLCALSISSTLTSSHSSLIYPSLSSAVPSLHFPQFNLYFLFFILLYMLVPVASMHVICPFIPLSCFFLLSGLSLCGFLSVCSLTQTHLMPKWLNLIETPAYNWRLTESHFNQRDKHAFAIQGKL